MPIFTPSSSSASLAVKKASSLIGTRSRLNFSAGSNMDIQVADNAAQNRVDITFAEVTTSFQQTLIDLGPSSYWHLDETSGTTAADVNSLVNGTYVSTPTLAQASLISSGGTSVFFGPSEGVNLGSASYRFAGTANWTFAAWVNISTINGAQNNAILYNMWVSGSGRQGFRIHGFGSGGGYKLEAERALNGASLYATSSGTYNAGDRVFVVVTYDGANLKLYANGALLTTTADSRSVASGATGSLAFASEDDFGTARMLNGYLDEPAIFTRALTLSEISSLYSAGL